MTEIQNRRQNSLSTVMGNAQRLKHVPGLATDLAGKLPPRWHCTVHALRSPTTGSMRMSWQMEHSKSQLSSTGLVAITQPEDAAGAKESSGRMRLCMGRSAKSSSSSDSWQDRRLLAKDARRLFAPGTAISEEQYATRSFVSRAYNLKYGSNR